MNLLKKIVINNKEENEYEQTKQKVYAIRRMFIYCILKLIVVS